MHYHKLEVPYSQARLHIGVSRNDYELHEFFNYRQQ